MTEGSNIPAQENEPDHLDHNSTMNKSYILYTDETKSATCIVVEAGQESKELSLK